MSKELVGMVLMNEDVKDWVELRKILYKDLVEKFREVRDVGELGWNRGDLSKDIVESLEEDKKQMMGR